MSLMSFTGSVDIRDVQCFFPSSYLDFKGKIVFQKHLIMNLEKLRLTPRLNNPKDSMVPSQCLKIFSLSTTQLFLFLQLQEVKLTVPQNPEFFFTTQHLLNITDVLSFPFRSHLLHPQVGLQKFYLFIYS